MCIITSTTPPDWKSLQNEVGSILEQCGFNVEIEKKLRLVRGEVEIDVYAEENVKGRRYSIICECKRWGSNIPQNVIHAFRTVVGDAGANIGYIIAHTGFQAGAYPAVDCTNIELVTWEEFQARFCDTWLDHYLSPLITKELDPILGYTEPLVPKWFCEVPDDEVEVLKALRDKYMEFGIMIMMFTTYSTFHEINGIPQLPMRESIRINNISSDAIPESILNATGYREFLEECLAFGKQGIDEFEAVKNRCGL